MKRPMSRVTRLTFTIVPVLIAMSAMGYWWLTTTVQRALARPINVAHEVLFEIAPGQTITKISRDLAARGWLTCALCLRLEATRLDLATRIQAGTYAVIATSTPRSLLQDFVHGTVKQYQMTIVEGTGFRALRAQLRRLPGVKSTLEHFRDDEIMTKIGAPDALPEGQFFPSTYNYPHHTSDIELLARAYRLMQQVLNDEWKDRNADLPYSNAYAALIMASIVEKETAETTERPLIAGVFVRRLQAQMKLQTDPTVIYGLGSAFDGNLRRQDLLTDSPYNTYTRAGLPPTPIALPGLAAIRAALHPAPSDALYFVARGDGTHEFSATLDAHNAAVRRYQLEGKGNSHGAR